MAEEPHHPITTPKGASAITIVLGVVSVFAPFLFDFQSALAVGALGVVLICWIYWAEARKALVERRWNPHLNVPLGAVLVILLMGVVLARHVTTEPRVAPALSADDVAKRVIAMMPKPSPQAVPAPQPQTPQLESAIPSAKPPVPAGVNCKTDFPYAMATYSGTKDGAANFGLQIALGGRLRQHNVAFEFVALTKDKPMIHPRDLALEFLDPGSQATTSTTSLFEYGEYAVHIRSDECDLWEHISLTRPSENTFREDISIAENNHVIKKFDQEGQISAPG